MIENALIGGALKYFKTSTIKIIEVAKLMLEFMILDTQELKRYQNLLVNLMMTIKLFGGDLIGLVVEGKYYK
jgi:hypothetical protein